MSAQPASFKRSNLLLERIKQATGVPFVHVPYKGIAPSLQDVAAGHIEGSVCAVVTALPLVEAGKIKMIGMLGGKRSKRVPDVPTLTEQGYLVPDESWYAIFGPPNMPRDLVMHVFGAIKEIASEEQTDRALANTGFTPWIQDPANLMQIARDESDRWGKLIREKNIEGE